MDFRHPPLLRRLLLLIALFLGAQWAAMVHAAEHPFHGEQESCAGYLSADHHTPALIAPPPLLLGCHRLREIDPSLIQGVSLAPTPLFRARAPPPHSQA